jgi:hypothetical protein
MLPPDIQKAIDDYDANVKAGVIVPWDPKQWHPTEHDEWLTTFLANHLPGWGTEDVSW